MQQHALTINRSGKLGIMMLITLAIASCATSDGGYGSGATRSAGSKITVCKSGDTLVNSSAQCLQDSAACYELADGKWCTGERGNMCPAGSVKVPDGQQCPNGTRCIAFGESLTCAIQVR